MNKLEKWLWVNCTLKDNGQNSNSLYFYYKNLEIRYSDHMAKQSTGDLQIIKSSNTIDFIIHYAQVNELLNTSAIKFTDAVKKDELILPETLYIPRPIRDSATNKIFKKKEEYWSNSEIKCLKQAIMQYFKQSCGFSTIFTKYLKENKVSFIQAINLYKILIFSNKTPFSGGNLSKVYNYIKSLESNEIQKIQL